MERGEGTASQNTQLIYQLSSMSYMGALRGILKQLQQLRQRSLITGHHKKCNNNEKV